MTTSPTRPRPRFKRLPAGALIVDDRIQRTKLVQKTMTEIVDDFDEAALATLTVSEREDGTFSVVDGGHRRKAVMMKFGADVGRDFLLPCMVHTGLSLREEAHLFAKINQQKPPRPTDLHKAMVTAGEPMAVAIDQAARLNGWKIGSGPKKYISAVLKLEAVYKLAEAILGAGRGSEIVALTLEILTEAYGTEEPTAVRGDILAALGELLISVEMRWADADKGREMELKVLSYELGKHRAGAKGFLEQSRGKAQGEGIPLHRALQAKLYILYNKSVGLQGKKLTTDVLQPLKGRGAPAREVSADATQQPLFSSRNG